MSFSFVVVVDPTEATPPTTVPYAVGIGAALPVLLTLLRVHKASGLLAPEPALAAAGQTNCHCAETTPSAQQLVRQLPGPAATQVLELSSPEAVEQAIRQLQPLLLVLGLRAEHTLLDQLRHKHLLPVLRATHHPLLLVPEATRVSGRPGRVLLAIDAGPYKLTAAARALAPLLASWQAAYTVAHALPAHALPTRSERQVLADVRADGLVPPDAPLWLYQEPATSPAAGILQALADTQADLLILLARPRSLWRRLFHRSVTAEVLRCCPVPVLLVPVAAPEQPGWMPNMS